MSDYDKSLKYISETQTLIGQKRKSYTDNETGEVIEVDQITKRAYGQKQFWKVYLMDFLQILGGFEFKQLDVLIYILENTQSQTNTFIGTYRKIADNVNVSTQTVQRTVNLLMDKKLMTKIQTGVYQISPEIMMKGNDNKKELLLSYYQDEPTNESDTK
ncbi:MAG: replication/maintenance protein RepL [Ruminococcus sp.]|nr:replication/maintenance protein RepL [Ruminococcus sp.]